MARAKKKVVEPEPKPRGESIAEALASVTAAAEGVKPLPPIVVALEAQYDKDVQKMRRWADKQEQQIVNGPVPATVPPAPEATPALNEEAKAEAANRFALLKAKAEASVQPPSPATTPAPAPEPALAEICQRHVPPEMIVKLAECYRRAVKHHHAGNYHSTQSCWHRYHEGLAFSEMKAMMPGAWVAFTEDKNNGLPLAGKTIRDRVLFSETMKRKLKDAHPGEGHEGILEMGYEEAKNKLGLTTKKPCKPKLPKPQPPAPVSEPEPSDEEVDLASEIVEQLVPLVPSLPSTALPPEGLDIEKPTFHIAMPELPPMDVGDGTTGRQQAVKKFTENQIVHDVILKIQGYAKRHPEGFNLVFEPR
jgi:hypothetical protein